MATALIPHYVVYPAYLLLSHDPRVDGSTFIPALQVVAVMVGGLLLGTVVSSSAPMPRLFSRERNLVGSPILLAGFVGAGLLGLLAVFAFATGTYNPLKAIAYARSPTYREAYLQYNLSYPELFLYGFVLAALALLIVRIYERQRKRDYLWALASTGVTCTVLLEFGSRAAFFLPVLIFLGLTNAMKLRIRWSTLLLLGIAAVPVFVFIRLVSVGYSLGELSSRGLFTNRSFIVQQFIGRFNGFAGLQDFLAWFSHQAYLAGDTIVQMIVRWVPRPLLPSKPPSVDVALSRAVYGQGPYGGSITLFGGVGEMYWNFGIVGVFLWFTLIGRVLYCLHFGTLELVRRRNWIGYAIVMSNAALLRGVVNMGVNTIGMQQFLMWLAAEVALLGLLRLVGGITTAAEDGRLPADAHPTGGGIRRRGRVPAWQRGYPG